MYEPPIVPAHTSRAVSPRAAASASVALAIRAAASFGVTACYCSPEMEPSSEMPVRESAPRARSGANDPAFAERQAAATLSASLAMCAPAMPAMPLARRGLENDRAPSSRFGDRPAMQRSMCWSRTSNEAGFSVYPCEEGCR
jgi:hypothetical protein